MTSKTTKVLFGIAFAALLITAGTLLQRELFNEFRLSIQPDRYGLIKLTEDGSKRTLVDVPIQKAYCMHEATKRKLMDSFNKVSSDYACIDLGGWYEEAERYVKDKL